MTRRKIDFIAAFSALALSLVIFIEVAGLKHGPGRFPLLVGIILAAAAVILGLKTFRRQTRPAAKTDSRLNVTAMLFPFISWLIVAMFIENIGFYLGAFLFMVANTVFITHKKPRVKDLSIYLCASILFMACIWVIFSYYLDMYLPSGMLFSS